MRCCLLLLRAATSVNASVIPTASFVFARKKKRELRALHRLLQRW